MWQKIIFVGNLGRDPETRYTPAGHPVTTFSVATNRRYTGSDGQPVEEVLWFQIHAWGKLAEVCQKYLAKGKQVLVEGRLVGDRETGGPRLWKHQDGSPGASFEVNAETVRFLGRKPEEGEAHIDPVSGTEEEIPF